MRSDQSIIKKRIDASFADRFDRKGNHLMNTSLISAKFLYFCILYSETVTVNAERYFSQATENLP